MLFDKILCSCFPMNVSMKTSHPAKGATEIFLAMNEACLKLAQLEIQEPYPNVVSRYFYLYLTKFAERCLAVLKMGDCCHRVAIVWYGIQSFEFLSFVFYKEFAGWCLIKSLETYQFSKWALVAIEQLECFSNWFQGRK